MSEFRTAVEEWTRLLGAERVIVDRDSLARLAKTTFQTTQRVPAALRPITRDELVEVVRIANRHRIPISAVSQGKNWGYGSKVPVQDGAVVIELALMNRVVDHNETLAYVTIEPGVTFRQLYTFLTQKQSRLMVGTGGTSPDASVVGNTLDRGISGSFNGDRLGQICALEVVLPTGEVVHTGFSRFGDQPVGHVNRWGVGPSLDGLFSQSNFGIVTRMTLWLARRPAHFQQMLFFPKDGAQLGTTVDAIRELLLDALPGHSALYWNDYRLLAGTRQYPWAEAGEVTPLPESFLTPTRKAMGGARWLGGIAIYSASEEEGLARRKYIRRALKDKVRHLLFLDETMKWKAALFSGPYQLLTGIDLDAHVETWLKRSRRLGVPDDRNVLTAYWRKRRPAPQTGSPDLEGDGCGVFWLCPTVPFVGDQLRQATDFLESTLLRHRFEPILSVIATSPRSAQIVTCLFYDREVPGEDERAMACYKEALEGCIARQWLPYRLGIQSMSSLPYCIDDSERVLARLKRALDPNRILNPGKYEFHAIEHAAETSNFDGATNALESPAARLKFRD